MEENHNYFEIISKYEDEFRRLLIDALKEGLDLVSSAVDTKKYIGHYYDWPQLSYMANGLPNYSAGTVGPIKYTDCFSGLGREPLVNEDEVSSFNNLVFYVENRPDLLKRFFLPEWKSSEDEYAKNAHKIFIKTPIKDAIELYSHRFETFVFCEKKAMEVATPILSYLFSKKLSISIVIPILFVDFEFDNFSLCEGTEIVRISDDLHLSRYGVKSYNVSVHEAVRSSATHALVLKNWSVPNSENVLRFQILSNPNAYPTDIIENFFGALRIVTGYTTGYSEILAKSIGWCQNCKANLPDISGATVRSYPSIFEDYYWNMDIVPKVSTFDCESIRDLYNRLSECKENSINIAVRRLNLCLVRDAEEDSVLDSTIALEALFSDGGNQEMTHKLAMRVAALAKISGEFENSPEQVFKDIKGIYSYRSAIVHGSRKLDKKRVIRVKENTVSTHSVAIRYLRQSIRILLKHPEYRNPINIDNKILLGGEKLA